MNKEQKQQAVSKIPIQYWWHSIDLGDGIITPGKITPKDHSWLVELIPNDLTGKTVLDVGCANGYYSFLCEKRGAKVTAIDCNDRLIEGFMLAKSIFNSKVEFHKMDLFSLPPKQYDIVLFMGVLYHLKNPLGALELMGSITKDLLVVESYHIGNSEAISVPIMRFYTDAESAMNMKGLETYLNNWWGCNILCIQEMLKVAGFERQEIVFSNIYKFNRVGIKAYKR